MVAARFHVQHLTHYYGDTYIDLYEGDGEAAWRRAERTWPEIRASLLLRIQHVKVDVLQLRGRSAVAAAAGARTPALAPRRRGVRPPARSPADGVGPGDGDADPGGRRSIRGDEARCRRLLAEALARSEAAHMGLFAAAARRRLGGLLGGDEGRALVAEADAWMASQGIRNPARMAAMLAPGFSARAS